MHTEEVRNERPMGGHPKPGMTAGNRHREAARKCGQSSPPDGCLSTLQRLHKMLNSSLRDFGFSL